MPCGTIECQVDSVVETYADRKAKSAFEEMKKHYDGGGCQCHQCMHLSVNEWNSWVGWFIEDPGKANLYLSKVYAAKNGRLKIAMGFSLEGK